MTPEQVKLVQDSFAQVVPIAATAADIFYDRLFAIAPQVKPLFPEDMREQKAKLMRMIGTAVGNLHQLDVIVDAVKNLAERHVEYGVRAEHYPVVGEALIFTLEKGLGDAFTAEVKEAWVETYGILSSVMIDAASRKTA